MLHTCQILFLKVNKFDGSNTCYKNKYLHFNFFKLYFLFSEVVSTEETMDQVARNLHNIKLDHDYTPLTRKPVTLDDDELMKTLTILDGPEHVMPLCSSEPPPLIITSPQKINKPTPKVKLIQSITLTPPVQGMKKVFSVPPNLAPAQVIVPTPKAPVLFLPKPATTSTSVPAVTDNGNKILQAVAVNTTDQITPPFEYKHSDDGPPTLERMDTIK